MNAEELQLVVLRGVISGAPDDERQKITAAADALRALILEHAESGVVALALVGAEAAAGQFPPRGR